jgi:hypothetical protein
VLLVCLEDKPKTHREHGLTDLMLSALHVRGETASVHMWVAGSHNTALNMACSSAQVGDPRSRRTEAGCSPCGTTIPTTDASRG